MKQHASQAAQHWQPAKYLKFADLRLRPALELLDRVPELPGAQPATSADGEKEPQVEIVDLGAGSCNMMPSFLYVGLSVYVLRLSA